MPRAFPILTVLRPSYRALKIFPVAIGWGSVLQVPSGTKRYLASNFIMTHPSCSSLGLFIRLIVCRVGLGVFI